MLELIAVILLVGFFGGFGIMSLPERNAKALKKLLDKDLKEPEVQLKQRPEPQTEQEWLKEKQFWPSSSWEANWCEEMAQKSAKIAANIALDPNYYDKR